jgi:nucleoid-associated protein YgaU
MSNPGLIKNYIAEAAVLPYRVVKFGSADGQVLQASAAADASFGVSDNIGQATAGARVDVIQSDIAEAEAGAAITRGALLSSDAQGRVITAAASAGTNVRSIGIAMASAAGAGEIIPISVEPGAFQG